MTPCGGGVLSVAGLAVKPYVDRRGLMPFSVGQKGPKGPAGLRSIKNKIFFFRLSLAAYERLRQKADFCCKFYFL